MEFGLNLLSHICISLQEQQQYLDTLWKCFSVC